MILCLELVDINPYILASLKTRTIFYEDHIKQLIFLLNYFWYLLKTLIPEDQVVLYGLGKLRSTFNKDLQI